MPSDVAFILVLCPTSSTAQPVLGGIVSIWGNLCVTHTRTQS